MREDICLSVLAYLFCPFSDMDTAEQKSTVYVDYISAFIGLQTSKLATYLGCCVQYSYKHQCEYLVAPTSFMST